MNKPKNSTDDKAPRMKTTPENDAYRFGIKKTTDGDKPIRYDVMPLETIRGPGGLMVVGGLHNDGLVKTSIAPNLAFEDAVSAESPSVKFDDNSAIDKKSAEMASRLHKNLALSPVDRKSLKPK